MVALAVVVVVLLYVFVVLVFIVVAHFVVDYLLCVLRAWKIINILSAVPKNANDDVFWKIDEYNHAANFDPTHMHAEFI